MRGSCPPGQALTHREHGFGRIDGVYTVDLGCEAARELARSTPRIEHVTRGLPQQVEQALDGLSRIGRTMAVRAGDRPRLEGAAHRPTRRVLPHEAGVLLHRAALLSRRSASR